MTSKPALWLAALFTVCTASSALAQLVPIDPHGNRDPLPVTVPADRIRPVDTLPGAPKKSLFDGWLHDVTVEGGYGYSKIESRVTRKPAKTNQRDYTLGASFRLFDRGFGALSVSHADQRSRAFNTPENFGTRIYSDGAATGAQVVGGWFVLPFLAAGGSASWGTSNGGYKFPDPTPLTPTKGSDHSYSPFVALLAPVDRWFFSLTAALTYAYQRQEYEASTPPEQDGWSRTSTLVLDASYRATDDVRFGGSLGWNHTLEQRAFASENGLDRDWYVVGLNAGYQVTRDLETVLRGTTWVDNANTNLYRVGLALRYKL